MTFESIRDVLFVQEGICEKKMKIKLIFLIFKQLLEVSFKGLLLEKMHTTLYLFCFHTSYCMFWNPKRAVRKKFEYFFIGNEHP